jgi:hypothetical protein
MLILNFTYPLRCLREPPGVRVPPVETTALEDRDLNLHRSENHKSRIVHLMSYN